ncbi:hypothetical protein FHS29_003092 [Saccharothrix tamanrassetensis]|uniref:DUF397 domain-containing protein n=1 Tax=Saccharothrix tamanrassetensis TaxID=1051531 RepID=A0A841CLR3_9PSEU|nr:DUF397 domain-containing protein [Saccharothrix tamanrassetensis]MBB5956506.1 hypothetical protein [Saccharothrix tamanrassetensis]
MDGLRHLAWRKSARSSGENGNCVEVARAPGFCALRDSKNPGGGVLSIGRRSAGAFLAAIKADRLGG